MRGRVRRFPYMVAEQDILIAQVEPATDDDGVRSGRSIAAVGLIKTASFAVLFGGGFNQGDRALVPPHDKMPIGVHHGPHPHAAILSRYLAGEEVHTHQDFVGAAIDHRRVSCNGRACIRVSAVLPVIAIVRGHGSLPNHLAVALV